MIVFVDTCISIIKNKIPGFEYDDFYVVDALVCLVEGDGLVSEC